MANGMKMWKVAGNTITLLFPLKGPEILHQKRRGQVNIIGLEHFNSILFHKSGPANKQHTYKSINVKTRFSVFFFLSMPCPCLRSRPVHSADHGLKKVIQYFLYFVHIIFLHYRALASKSLVTVGFKRGKNKIVTV